MATYYDFSIHKKSTNVGDVVIQVGNAFNCSFSEGSWHLYKCQQANVLGFRIFILPFTRNGDHYVCMTGDSAIDENGDYPLDSDAGEDVSSMMVDLLLSRDVHGWQVTSSHQGGDFDFGIRLHADWD